MKGRNLLMIQYDLRYFADFNLFPRLDGYAAMEKIRKDWHFREGCICAMIHLAYNDFTGNLDAPV